MMMALNDEMMRMTADNICVVILAGGSARRMGGGCKLLLDIDGDGGKNVLDYLLAALAGDGLFIAINSNLYHEDIRRYHLPIFPDLQEFHAAGPLAGLVSAFDYAEKCQRGWVLTVASDTPFIPQNIGARFVKKARDIRAAKDFQHKLPLIVSARSHARMHPTTSLLPVRLKENLLQHLRLGNRKIAPFFAQYQWQSLDFAVHDFDPFFNINSQEDLQTARKIAKTYRFSASKDG